MKRKELEQLIENTIHKILNESYKNGTRLILQKTGYFNGDAADKAGTIFIIVAYKNGFYSIKKPNEKFFIEMSGEQLEKLIKDKTFKIL